MRGLFFLIIDKRMSLDHLLNDLFAFKSFFLCLCNYLESLQSQVGNWREVIVLMMHYFSFDNSNFEATKQRAVKYDSFVFATFSAHVEPELPSESLE